MADSKDRYGDTLRKKEKAEEDRYFAEQDAARLAKIRAERESGEFPKGRCPRDGSPLVEQTLNDVVIDICGTCAGIWLDKGELEALSERLSEPWFSKWVRNVLGG